MVVSWVFFDLELEIFKMKCISWFVIFESWYWLCKGCEIRDWSEGGCDIFYERRGIYICEVVCIKFVCDDFFDD